MSTRNRILRRSLLISLIVLSMLVSLLTLQATHHVHAASSCSPIAFIGVRGSGEAMIASEYNMGEVVSKTFIQFQTQMQQSGVNVLGDGLAYAAVPFPSNLADIANLAPQVDLGVTMLVDDLAILEAACPGQQIILSGYSQGAWVIQSAFDNKASADNHIKAVILYGDPLFDPQASYARGGDPTLSGVVGKEDLPPWIPPNNIRSYCLNGDPICNFSGGNAASCVSAGAACPHLQYDSEVTDASNFLSQIFASTQNTTSTPTPTSTNASTPTPTPTPPCTASGDGVTLFVDPNYGGSTCHTFGVGEYSDLSQFGLDLNVSSLQDTNAAYHITFFDQTGLTGTPGYYDANTPQLTGYWDNRARSMRVERHSTDGVTLCTDASYGGSCHTFGVGEYSDLSQFGLDQDVSSLQDTNAAYHITLFDQKGLTGTPGYYDADTSQLTGYWDNRARSMRVEMHSTDGVTLYVDGNYGGTSHTFGVGEYSDLSQFSLDQNVSSLRDTNAAYHITLFDQKGLTGTPGYYDADTSQLTGYWDNRARSMRVEKHRPTTCNPGTDGIIAYIDTNYQAGCLFITGDIPDLTTYNFEHVISSIRFAGNYTNSEQIAIYRQANYQDLCGTFSQDQPDLLSCSDQAVSVQVLPFTPPVTPTPSPTTTPSPTPTASCPSGWNCADIGGPNLSGSESLSNGTWSIQGSGGDIWNTADQFHYDWQSLPGDGNVSAQILTQDNTDGWAKAGVMLRQDNTPGSAFYMVALTPGNGITVQYRTDQGVNAQMNAQITGSSPVYLQAIRVGNTFTAATSSDGVSWNTISGSSATLNVSGTMLAGLGITSHSASLGTATFNSVSITQSAPTSTPTPSPTPTASCPAGWACADIGNPNLSGSESLNNNIWTVQGSGGDIWNAADQFHYDWQSLSGDGSVSAQVLTQDNTDGWAKAGVMLRQDNTPGSAFYMIALTPGNGITVQYRTDQGANAQMNAQISGTAPVYVMAVRTGNTFTAATSSDGVTWTTVSGSSATLNVNGAMLAGLAVTSHSASPGTVTFNSVSITAATSPSPTPSPSPTATTPTPTPTTSPTPTSTGVELLPAPWHLSGNNGASELYQSIDPNALNGMTRVQITYNLHGLQALGNDASAIIIDQNGWHYISLSNYGQNGLDGNQTVTIPLSDFGLDLTQPIDGTIHTRFWYGSQFTVDIISIQLLP